MLTSVTIKIWIASFDPAKSKEIIFIVEHFPAAVPAAHTELRISFDSGNEVELQEQVVVPGQAPAAVKLREISFSVEAVKKLGESFNIFTGVAKHFVVAYRFLSMADVFQDAVTTEHHETNQYKLTLNDQERESILRNGLMTSNGFGMTQFYNTLLRSCTTELFRLIDRSIHFSFWEKADYRLRFMDQVYPIWSEDGLEMRNLILANGSSLLPNLDQDQELIKTISHGQ